MTSKIQVYLRSNTSLEILVILPCRSFEPFRSPAYHCRQSGNHLTHIRVSGSDQGWETSKIATSDAYMRSRGFPLSTQWYVPGSKKGLMHIFCSRVKVEDSITITLTLYCQLYCHVTFFHVYFTSIWLKSGGTLCHVMWHHATAKLFVRHDISHIKKLSRHVNVMIL